MSNEIKHIEAQELSVQELDNVAGGAFQVTATEFKFNEAVLATNTQSGPKGSSIQTLAAEQKIDTSAFQVTEI